MAAIDAPSVLKAWFSDWKPRWTELSMKPDLKLPDPVEDLNKASASFETPTHVAGVTAWGTSAVERGTLEIIVLDVATKMEVISKNNEYATAEDLRRLLDACANTLITVMSRTT